MPTYLDDPQEYALRAAGLVNAAGVPRTAENYNRASQYIAQGQVGAGPVFEQAMDRMLARPTPSQVRKAQPLPLPPPEAPEPPAPQGGQTPLPPVAAGTSATPATPEAVIDDVLNADVHRTPQTGRHTPTTPPVLLGEGIDPTAAGLGITALLSILRGKPRVPLGVTLNPRGGGSGGPAASGGGGALPGGGGGGGGGPLPGPVPGLPSSGGQAVPMPSAYNRGMAVENDPTVVVSPALKPAPNLNPDPNVKRYPPVPGSAGDGTVNSDLFLDGYAVNKPTKPKLEDEVKRRMRLNKQRDQRRSRRGRNDSEE